MLQYLAGFGALARFFRIFKPGANAQTANGVMRNGIFPFTCIHGIEKMGNDGK